MNERTTRIDRILRDRIRTHPWGTLRPEAGEENGAHPDENQISAFAEGALPRDERAATLAHLAVCAECREILAAVAAEAPPATRGVLRWARGTGRWVAMGAAAAAVCVLAFVLARSRKAESVATAALHAPLVLDRNGYLPEAATRPPSPSLSPRMAAQAKPRRAPAMAIAPASHTVTSLSGDATPMPPVPQQIAAPDGLSLERAAGVSDSRATGGRALGSQFLSPQFRARADANQRGYEAYPTPAIWSIDIPQNRVERSVDNGRTWEPVRIADRVTFQAVATAGSHIWAGGAEGALFHSADGGLHWERMAIADGSAKLTGTIVAIDAPSPTQVLITTRAGERWITFDSGVHWTKTT